jgi:hypothetical protein
VVDDPAVGQLSDLGPGATDFVLRHLQVDVLVAEDGGLFKRRSDIGWNAGRCLYVRGDSGSQPAVYAIDNQVYANNKISKPQSDVLRVVVGLQKVRSAWKISDVTVLDGATPASTGSASGSAGSSVPGQ